MRADKQMKIAGETDYFYAPLANRLGLYHVKSELENLSFRYRCPREYTLLEKLLREEFEREDSNIKAFTSKIERLLSERGIEARTEVRYRKP
jgi:GTP pyrophosphokinase